MNKKVPKPLKEKILKYGDKVRFKAMDDTPGGTNLGHAEFIFCPVWKYRRIKELYIYRAQQRNVKEYYKKKVGYSDSFMVHSWTHKGIEEPRIWLMSYCKEHKTVSYHVYVPRNSDYFTVEAGSTLCVNFDKEKK